jgi:NAD(P)H-hydrate repair Nnr-like enzyme with NAD(P)H-hydrate dehydratase domain
MDRTYWHKQTKENPLFPDLLWSRPENRAHAGKLLVIGGNAHGFAAPAEAYMESMKAGVGLTRVLLPDAVKAAAGHALETVDFAPSTPSGSFSKKSLAEFLDHAAWADGVLLAGDLGRNSETAILLESFLQKYVGLITLTKDAIDYTYGFAELALTRPDTTLVLTLAQLQKLAKAAKYTKAVQFSISL